MKIGLKLWSTNEGYLNAARRLWEQRLYDYIELFVVPGTVDSHLPLWTELPVPYILHAPHSAAGLNPSRPELAARNLELMFEVDSYRETLNPRCTVFHPGLEGSVEETIRQFGAMEAVLPRLAEQALIENKPSVGLNGERCVGASPDELQRLLEGTGFGFCLDIGHAVAYAAAVGIDGYELVERLRELHPPVYHLSDTRCASVQDQHLNLGQGDLDIARVLRGVPDDAFLTLETAKASEVTLDDFVEDVAFVKRARSSCSPR